MFPDKPKKKKIVYLDHAATTYCREAVRETMDPYFFEQFANPSSLYSLGREVNGAINSARRQVADILGTVSDSIIFTSGGTESDNLAIFGVAQANKEKGRHIITTAGEHPAVLHALQELEKQGFQVTYLSLDRQGNIDLKELVAAICPETILVSIMYANNEIGTIYPIADIGREILKWRKAKNTPFPFFHSDACQAAGVVDLSVEKNHVDLLTLNGSKIYGPKGVGVLYVRRGVKLMPLQVGGSQEKGLRPGTEHIAGIIGLAKALEIADEEREGEQVRLTLLRDNLIERVLKDIPKTRLNGHPTKRLPNNVNISFMDLEGEALLLYLDAQGIFASTGSACASASLDPSHVILALGVPFEVAHGSIRFTLGRSTTEMDIDRVLEILPPLVEKLRSLSPVRVNEKYFAL